MTKQDWLWSGSGLLLVGISSGLLMKGMEVLTGGITVTPSFMTFAPLDSDRYWLLLIWLPYWILNIMGEEILWRGVMLPRQEVTFGRHAWLVHGFGWGLFHVAFGWKMMIPLIPILFIQSYIVQKTKNSWTGVVIHAVVNGPSFLAIALGWL